MTTPNSDAQALTTSDAPELTDERKAFERFFMSRKSRGAEWREKALLRREDETYVEESTQRHWWTWQNAAADRALRAASPPAPLPGDTLVMKQAEREALSPEGHAKLQSIVNTAMGGPDAPKPARIKRTPMEDLRAAAPAPLPPAETEAVAQLRHLVDDLVTEHRDEVGLITYTVTPSAWLLFSNMVGACKRLLTQPTRIAPEEARPAPKPAAWVSPMRYGSQVTFYKPTKPERWDDDDGACEWFCEPLYRPSPKDAQGPHPEPVDVRIFWHSHRGWQVEWLTAAPNGGQGNYFRRAAAPSAGAAPAQPEHGADKETR